MPKKDIDDLGDLMGKRVLVRVDFNVPLDKKTGAVKNDRRIRAALPTVRKLLDKGAAVVAMSHLGRPEKASPEERKNLTMDRVAARFGELLGQPVKKAADDVVGPAVEAAGSPRHPLLAIMGGAKVSDKINFINALLKKVDQLLIGGKMTYAFLKAQGIDVGGTKVDDAEVAAAKPLLDWVDRSITLPVDSLC